MNKLGIRLVVICVVMIFGVFATGCGDSKDDAAGQQQGTVINAPGVSPETAGASGEAGATDGTAGKKGSATADGKKKRKLTREERRKELDEQKRRSMEKTLEAQRKRSGASQTVRCNNLKGGQFVIVIRTTCDEAQKLINDGQKQFNGLPPADPIEVRGYECVASSKRNNRKIIACNRKSSRSAIRFMIG